MAAQGRRGTMRRSVVAALTEVGELQQFAGSAARELTGVGRYTSEVLRQFALLVRGTTLFIFVMTFLIGVATSSFGFYFLRSAGAADYIGLASSFFNTRAGVQIMFGFIFAAKVGCTYASELGTMRVAQELDGYHAEAVSPMRYVVATRLAGTALFTPIAAAAALAGANIGSWANAVFVIGAVSESGFERFNWGLQTFQDQLFAFITISTVAIGIALIGCFYGWRTRGGPDAVGRAVAASMRLNLLLTFTVFTFYAQVFYGTDPRLPIGG